MKVVHRDLARLAVASLAILSACALQPPAWRSAALTVSAKDDDGSAVQLVGKVCRPAADAKSPVVIINHGSPPSARQRLTEAMAACDDEALTWFLSRGFVVVQVLRRGYGESGGTWAEDYGRCSNPDFVTAGLETASDIDAAVKAATALPYVDPSHVVVLGQSAGAWGTLAYGSLGPSGVAALVAVAPGRGGHRSDIPNRNCNPEHLVAAAGRFGSTSPMEVLWLNTRNDRYFAPKLVLNMQQAFTRAGGKVTVVNLGSYDDDGHQIFFGDGGSAMWGPVVAAYLTQKHVPMALPGPEVR
ncbi:prolyl oligopeptidase family serine peptidase [Lichenicola cladoniae]|uniref:Prolyl oligopeptidase family serine peptidase n=1 Tax=Lichenicola cladoniae TaxID=1484109 RepID=A0A6M8HP32_9PROT|nr:prolyl oligopeptidase family serine peptidase [Lichenicola cladoniae]NPD68485.1 prolyl oligopeptidase family serine peptidase [Acetobacteraceae bacterium]QKE90037.1 prolyl oligopeptidase family serine peptidase [Lichenicola cladoniae]